jgi:hypothetical protein
MKLSQSRRGFLAVVIAGACLLPSVSSAATIVVGTGPDTSFLVLESPNLGARTYEIHYTYNSSASQDAFFLLGQVLTSDANYTLGLTNYGSMMSPNYIVDSISYNGVPETGVSTPPYTPYWAHWVARGEAGFPTASPKPAGIWSFGSGISSPYRLIAPDSWDALYFSDGNTAPSVAPIPETSSALLAVLGSLAVFKRRRNP